MDAKPAGDAPHGMEPYDLGGPNDLGALSNEQQEKLNNFKIKTRLENENYLRKHPEVQGLISGFLSDVLTKRPENVRDFAAEYFTNPELPQILQQQLEERQQELKTNKIIKNM